MKKRRWTEDEDIYLEYFAYENDEKVKEAALFLNRSVAAVYTRMYILRKNNPVWLMQEKWTEKEDEFLKKNHLNTKNKVLAQRLNRTEEAVEQRKSFLGLRKISSPLIKRKEKIISLIDKGYSRKEISEELNIKYATLNIFLNRNNIYCKKVSNDIRTKAIKKIISRQVYKNYQ